MPIEHKNNASFSLERLARGDRSEWKALYAQYSRLINSISADEGVPQSGIDDVAQEVWISVQRLIADGSLPNSIPAWISTTTRHAARNWLTRVNKHVHVEQTTGEPIEPPNGAVAPSPEDVLMAEELRLQLDGAIEALPERQRTALQYALDGATQEHTAKAMGIAQKNVHVLLQRAKANLERATASNLDSYL